MSPGIRQRTRRNSGEKLWRRLGLLGALVLAAGCGAQRNRPAPEATAASASSPQAAAPVTSEAPLILFVGTSLTAGYGLDDPEAAYPALIRSKLEAAGLRYRVANAGVSGETSAGALRRIDWLLRQKVAVLVLEIGANDGLRGQDPAALRANIRAILERARQQSPAPKLLLVGMKTLTNYGRDYGRRFEAVYPELARETGAALVPFLLEGVAGIPSLNQPDGVHPNADGQRKMAETVWAVLRPLLG